MASNNLSTVDNKSHILTSSCKELWVSVINQALVDAFSHAEHPRNKAEKISAIKWIVFDEVNFENVCQLAGLNHQKTRYRIIEIMLEDEKIKKIIMNLDEKNKYTINIVEYLQNLVNKYEKNPNANVLNLTAKTGLKLNFKHQYGILKHIAIY